jgi:hypothetical protein
MRLELERGLKLFFQKNLSKLSLILFQCFLCCSFTFDIKFFFGTLQFVHPMTQLNLAKELGKYWKVFDGKYVFNDGPFYLN